ncbi:MAG: hypothetical protein QOJ19_1293, partial [Acidimicrobiia bacterium]|nr:hypothetical protein [Acidimicrobiia bacterium]
RRLRLQRRYHQGQRGNENRAYPPFHPYPASLTPFEDGSGRRSCRTPAPLAPIASAENLPSTPEPRYNQMSLQRQLLSRTTCRLSKARHRPTVVRRAAPEVPPRAGRNAGAEPARNRRADELLSSRWSARSAASSRRLPGSTSLRTRATRGCRRRPSRSTATADSRARRGPGRTACARGQPCPR